MSKRHFIYFNTVIILLAFTTVALAGTTLSSDPINTAQRVEKLGIVGVLSLSIIVLLIAFAWLLRLIISQGVILLNKATAASVKQAETNDRLHEALKELKDHCARR